MRVSRRPFTGRHPKPRYRGSSGDVGIERPRAKKAERLPEPLREKGELILVVDDEAVILRIIKMILESANYRVLCASDGAKAIEIFTQHMSAIKAVVTDINMPSIDGVTLIRAMSQMKSGITFVATTGGEESVKILELKNLGVESFLLKPFNIDELLKTLRGVLEGRPSGLNRAGVPASQTCPVIAGY
jgi:CheY-like chemotaxis protein